MIKIELLFRRRRQFYDNRYVGFLKADWILYKKDEIFFG